MCHVRCRNRWHSPVRGRSTTGQHGSRRVHGWRVLRGPLGDRRGQGRSALVIITGASTSCGVALRRHLVARVLARRRPTPIVTFPAPWWCASMRLASCRTAVASVWSLVQLPRVASGRLGRCPIGCDRHQPSRVKGASCCGPQGGSFEASTRASGRRGGGDQGPEAMIASRT
jgi:hypothetical protein